MKLPAKQERFCQEYILDLNATQAALRAGYSDTTAKSQGSRLLTKCNVQERVSALKTVVLDSALTDAKWLLTRLREVDDLDIADIMTDDFNDFKPLKDWPKVWRTSISGVDLMVVNNPDETTESILKKIKWPDKVKNRELIGKHIDVAAFSENLNVKTDVHLSPWGEIKAGIDS